MQREMAQHLDQATNRLARRGLSRDEARNAAIREFGNMTYHKEEARQARGTRWLDALAADSRYAVRHFRRNPGATVTMLIVLAIGMSISTALFSFLQAYAKQPPPGVAVSDDLVRIRGRELTEDGVNLRWFTTQELEEYQRLTSHFAAVTGYASYGVSLYAEGDIGAESGAATFVTPNYFDVLGVRPVIGGGLPRQESSGTDGPLVGIVSYAVWERFFSRSPAAIGATLTVDGVPVTIVGVAPPRFTGLDRYDEMGVWMPMASRPIMVSGFDPRAENHAAVGRLAAGTDYQRAIAAVDVIARRVTAAIEETQPPPHPRRVGADVVPLFATNFSPQLDGQVFALAILTSGIGVLLLLVTCTNVSALQTGLAMNRRREIAIRLSMGASRRRIVRQLLTEAVILAALAGGLGLGIMWLIQRFLVTQIPDAPLELAVSGPTLAFVFGTALAVGTLFGLSPALHATRLGLSSALKDSTAAIAAPRVRLQRGLVVAQIALTQPLIVVLAVSLVAVYDEYRDMGFDQSREQLVSVRLRPAAQSSDSTPQWAAEMRGLRDRLRSMPSIAGAVQDLESTVNVEKYFVHPDDRVGAAPEQPIQMSGPVIAPGYLDVMGMRIILGRDFDEGDRTPPINPKYAGIEVPVIVGSDLAGDLWPGANPLGRRLRSTADPRVGPTLTVVGVLEPERRDKLEMKGESYEVYFPPDSARVASSLLLLVRTTGDGRSLIPAIRQAVQEGTSRLVITDTRTLADMELEMRELFTLAGTSLGTAGCLMLLLAAIGLYAVVSFAVGQRTSEIAVRMAVGARAGQIVGTFVAEGVRLGVIGLAIGLPLSFIGMHVLTNASNAPLAVATIISLVGLGVLTVALMATWIPARRAAGVDPALVLRRD